MVRSPCRDEAPHAFARLALAPEALDPGLEGDERCARAMGGLEASTPAGGQAGMASAPTLRQQSGHDEVSSCSASLAWRPRKACRCPRGHRRRSVVGLWARSEAPRGRPPAMARPGSWGDQEHAGVWAR
jgi:hypothetical protein